MPPPDAPPCRVVATREANSRLWSFFLVNDGGAPIASAELAAVRYEWGDQYVGGESPRVPIGDLAPGARVLIWRDDGSSETRVDLWLRVTHQGQETWLLFEFPRLYKQQGTSLEADPMKASGPPS